jgi:hypothetical protein
LQASSWYFHHHRRSTTVSRLQHTFKAQCVTDVDKDEVLATALVVFANEHEVIRSVSKRMGTVVFIAITINAVDPDVSLARRAAESLLHRWPTDTVSFDGRPIKYHGSRAVHTREG